MSNVIRIAIPTSEDDEDIDLLEYFNGLVGEECSGELVAALDLDSQDSRATLHSIEIVGATTSESEITLEYSVEFSAYYGCKDMDGSYVEEGLIVTGVKDGNDWVFVKHVSPPQRYPDEEL